MVELVNGHIYLNARSRLDKRQRAYAVSQDGDHWVKDPVPTLTNGPSGSIDEYACFACYLVRRDRRWWMYYSTAVGKGGRFYRVSLAKSRRGE